MAEVNQNRYTFEGRTCGGVDIIQLPGYIMEPGSQEDANINVSI